MLVLDFVNQELNLEVKDLRSELTLPPPLLLLLSLFPITIMLATLRPSAACMVT